MAAVGGSGGGKMETTVLEQLKKRKTLYNTTAEYTLFSSSHEAFSTTDHILGRKWDRNKV